MQNKITFFVLSTTGAPVRQATASKTFLVIIGFFTAVLLIIGIGVSGFGIYHYAHMKDVIAKNKAMMQEKGIMEEEISVRDSHIAKLAKDINSLKTRLLALNEYERKVRKHFGGTEEENDAVYGIGGSIPEDIDATEQLRQDHRSLIREMHSQLEQLNHLYLYEKQGFKVLLENIEKQKNLLAATPSIRPAKGYASSHFGRRKSPFTGLHEFHKGLDIAAPRNTKIFATADGVVTFSGRKGFFGNLVVIDHGYGMVTRYGHASKLLKKKGESVKRGDVIALVGNTGRSTGPHVHYEVRLNGIPVNPEYYILN